MTDTGFLRAELRCVLCGAAHRPTADASVCPRHEGLTGILDVITPGDARPGAGNSGVVVR
jgi:hypothetical protein